MGEELKKAITQAIFDPGQEVGMRHDRALHVWQADAVMNVLDRALPRAGEGEEVERLRREMENLGARAESFWAFLQGEHGVKLSAEDHDDHNVYEFFAALRSSREG